MNPKLASWLRSFAVAALMIGIAGVVLFNRIHVGL